jgi:hypothetical protein
LKFQWHFISVKKHHTVVVVIVVIIIGVVVVAVVVVSAPVVAITCGKYRKEIKNENLERDENIR